MYYLGIKFKNGSYRTYKWDNVDFSASSGYFIVREVKTGELLLAVKEENIEYYERIENKKRLSYLRQLETKMAMKELREKENSDGNENTGN